MSFKYLASPYSHIGDASPEEKAATRQRRYEQALACLAQLLTDGVDVFSTIVHTHEASKRYSLPTDAAFWQRHNHAMIEASDGVIVLQVDGWEESVGVQEEINFAQEIGKPITYIT